MFGYFDQFETRQERTYLSRDLPIFTKQNHKGNELISRLLVISRFLHGFFHEFESKKGMNFLTDFLAILTNLRTRKKLTYFPIFACFRELQSKKSELVA